MNLLIIILMTGHFVRLCQSEGYCENKRHDCADLVLKCKCVHDKPMMEMYCSKACGFCGTDKPKVYCTTHNQYGNYQQQQSYQAPPTQHQYPPQPYQNRPSYESQSSSHTNYPQPHPYAPNQYNNNNYYDTYRPSNAYGNLNYRPQIQGGYNNGRRPVPLQRPLAGDYQDYDYYPFDEYLDEPLLIEQPKQKAVIIPVPIICQDSTEGSLDCVALANMCLCQMASQFMLERCALSCGFCGHNPSIVQNFNCSLIPRHLDNTNQLLSSSQTQSISNRVLSLLNPTNQLSALDQLQLGSASSQTRFANNQDLTSLLLSRTARSGNSRLVPTRNSRRTCSDQSRKCAAYRRQRRCRNQIMKIICKRTCQIC